MVYAPHWCILAPSSQATPGYLVSMVLMVSEKRKERVPAWEAFENAPGNFRTFFHRVLEACTTDWERYSIAEHAMLLLFLVHAFNSLVHIYVCVCVCVCVGHV